MGENESSKYWLSVLYSFKNQGVQDILIMYADGLSGIERALLRAMVLDFQSQSIPRFQLGQLRFISIPV